MNRPYTSHDGPIFRGGANHAPSARYRHGIFMDGGGDDPPPWSFRYRIDYQKEGGSQKPGVRRQKSGVRSQKSEGRGRKEEERG